jgi:fucose 4-O-acetylase-like acetyltransferase
MIFDVIVALIFVGALFNGYKNGLLTTILRTAFFIAGGVAAMYFVVKYDQSGWLIVAIIVGAYAAAWVGTQLAKTLKLTLIRGPLRLFDSALGAVLEVGKYVLLFYVVGTILLWAPWSSGQNAVAESEFYLQVNKHAPGVIADIRREVEKALANPRL